jgi:hypothetical protein
MAKKNRAQEEAFGNDSFLDVVANIVGILIILVVVASMRIKHLPSLLSPELQSRDKAVAALAEAETAMGSVERDLLEVTAETQRVTLAAASRHQERAVLAQVVAHKERELDEKRKSLSGGARDELELEQALAMNKAKLARFAQEMQDLQVARPKTIQINTYSTPISQIVMGKEIYFQLKGGFITLVPINELVEKFKHKAQQQIDRLRDSPQFTDIVGPIDGFRLRYTMERVDPSPDSGHSGSYARMRKFELVPMADDLGEPVTEALAAQSQFRTALVGLDAKRTTVTLWTYDDSFALFRAVRKELHEMGFSVAGRPLVQGQPIAGSPDGTRSAAQ